MSQETKTSVTTCPECGSEEDWRGGSWCPSCGYYPAINRQVNGAVVEDEDDVIYEHWWEVVPQWLWICITAVVALAVVNLAVRMMFARSSVRVWWTVGEFALGLIGLGAAHFMAYLFSVSRSDKLGPLDMVLKPLATWQPVLLALPKSSNLVLLLCCSISAMGMSVYVVNGVDIGEILQAEAERARNEREAQARKEAEEGQKKGSPMAGILKTAAVVAQVNGAVNQSSQPQSLEEALAAFAGDGDIAEAIASGELGSDAALQEMLAEQGLSPEDLDEYLGEAGLTEEENPEAEQEGDGQSAGDGVDSRTSTKNRGKGKPVSGSRGPTGDEVECLVLGYTTNVEGEIRSLLLAAAPDRRLLRFVAKVPVEQVNPEVLAQLTARFPEIPAAKCLVRCPYGGRWVRPELFCIVRFSGWTADNRMNNVEILRMR